MKRLSAKNDVPIYVFVEDVAASGGYLISCAADEIIVDPSSVVGNVGVIRPSVGIHKLAENWGVTNTTRKSGERKELGAMLRPETKDEKKRTDSLLRQLHREFKGVVRESRGAKIEKSLLLKLFRGMQQEYPYAEEGHSAFLSEVAADPAKFDMTSEQASAIGWASAMTHAPTDVESLLEGDVFVGEQAVHAGFADRVGHLKPIMLEKLNAGKDDDVKFVKVPSWRGWFGGFGGASMESSGGGCVLGDAMMGAVSDFGESIGRGAVGATLRAAEEEEAAAASYGGRARL